jgi:pilus assembly protein Flp/PilA
MKKLLARFRRDEEGASLVEYGLLVALIAVAAVGAIRVVGTDINTMFTSVSADL